VDNAVFEGAFVVVHVFPTDETATFAYVEMHSSQVWQLATADFAPFLFF
jgi:hypothetical protein